MRLSSYLYVASIFASALILESPCAYALGPMAAMQIGGITSPPMGHVQFCQEHSSDCQNDHMPNRVVQLDGPTFQQLAWLNSKVNHDIAPMTDMELYGVPDYWTYPTAAGDCEDYVLLKIRDLQQLGWPDGSLLITVVRDEEGEGHAILTVRTDRGDLILDNKTDEIILWNAKPYQFIKRQSTENKAQWVQIIDNRNQPVASLRPQTPYTSAR